MKKKAEKAYFNEQWELMSSHLKTFIKIGDQEELHLFRVQVKKLRAMLTLLDVAEPKQKLLKDFKPVRKIFQLCGDIRNAYINLQMGVRFRLKNEEFIMTQLYEIEKGTNDFKEQGKKYLKIIKTAHDAINSDLKSVGDDDINHFYNTYLQQIGDVFNNLQFDEELHKARRQIKTLIYNRKMAQKALEGKLQVNNDYLDKLQGLIGDWHDNILALELFSSIELNDQQVITKIRRQNTRLKRSITLLSKDFTTKSLLNETLPQGE
ncbi:MAG: CHAD domain-containing protein [Mucilaginibacter sp.]